MKSNIYDFFNQRTFRRYPLFDEFAIFFLLFNLLPYLVWKNDQAEDSYALKILGGLMSILLLVRGLWQAQYSKYFGLFWYSCIFICLPLSSTIILFENNLAEWSLINLLCGILVLSVLVESDIFLLFIISGLFFAYLYVSVFYGINIMELLSNERGEWLLYGISISVIVSVLFTKNHENFYYLSLDKAKESFGLVCHEIKHPLSTLKILNENFCNQLSDDIGQKENYIKKFNILMDTVYYTIDDTLAKLQLDKVIELERINIANEVINIIDTYPFKLHEKKLLDLNFSHNFNFLGNKDFFKFVIFNLINNSLYYLSSQDTGRMKLYAEHTSIFNLLIIEDNGPGIPERDLELIFKSFYTKKAGGTGLGLAFCKKAMQKFGGDIICESELGKYTRFKLIFPLTSQTSLKASGLEMQMPITKEII
jgi:signal transduction histidine kinase